MRALILAGGLGTRLRPITNDIPKCLVEVGGKPMLEYWIEHALSLECEQILINTHYLNHLVEAYIASSPNKERIILVHEPELLGTLGTIRRNQQFLAGGDFFVAHADNFCIANWQEFKASFFQRNPQCHMSLMSFDTETPQTCGMLKVDDNDILQSYIEKPGGVWEGTTANGAVFLFSAHSLEAMLALSPCLHDLCKDFLPGQLGKCQVFHNSDCLIDIGNIDSLTKARARAGKWQ